LLLIAIIINMFIRVKNALTSDSRKEKEMPIYSYRCKDCQNTFDLLIGVTSDQAELKCEKCGSANIEKTMGSFSVRMGLATIPSGSGGSCSSGGCCPTY